VSAVACGGGAYAPEHHHVHRAPQLVGESSQSRVEGGEGIARACGSRATASTVGRPVMTSNRDNEVRVEQSLRNRGDVRRVKGERTHLQEPNARTVVGRLRGSQGMQQLQLLEDEHRLLKAQRRLDLQVTNHTSHVICQTSHVTSVTSHDRTDTR
jgi:hypothetical protein